MKRLLLQLACASALGTLAIGAQAQQPASSPGPIVNQDRPTAAAAPSHPSGARTPETRSEEARACAQLTGMVRADCFARAGVADDQQTEAMPPGAEPSRPETGTSTSESSPPRH